MSPHELLADIHALEQELLEFERRYGIRSETFFAAYGSGEEPEDDSQVLDFGAWASVYRTLLDRRKEYASAVLAQATQKRPERQPGADTEPYQWRRDDAYEERFARYDQKLGSGAADPE
jgi:hypothetical protein